jgi:hypothetical protein
VLVGVSLRRTAVITVCIGGWAVVGPVARPSAETAPGCVIPGTRTLAQSRLIRVVERLEGDSRGEIDACRLRTGQVVILGSAAYKPPAFTVAGEVVVGAWDSCDPAEGTCDTTVIVDRPFAGSDQFHVYAPTFFRFALARSIVGSIVARSNGAAAWIACLRVSEDFNSSRRHCMRPGGTAQVVAVAGFRQGRRLLTRVTESTVDPAPARPSSDLARRRGAASGTTLVSA